MTRTTILLVALLMACSALNSQSLTGRVVGSEGEALSGAFVNLENTFLYALTDTEGYYSFSKVSEGQYMLQVTHMGYLDHLSEVIIAGEATTADVVMKTRYFTTEEVVVRGLRADEETPMAYSNVSAEELAQVNLGQDVPELLNATPSLFFTSDAGNGVGYTYLRLRGSDQTNINVQINGIPLNDSESQGVFWVNMPDLASSTSSIQIQRGVGTSTNGAGAFGGSINMLLEPISAEGYGSLSASFGSFDTQRLNARFGTGLINGHWSFDGRLSTISSDGYVDRSGADMSSYYLAGAYVDDKTSIRAITFGGKEVTSQAWFGVPEGILTGDTALTLAFAGDNGFTEADSSNALQFDRRFNYYTYDREVDDYQQDHYQLHISRSLHKDIFLNVAGHYTKGRGFFEQYQDQDNFTHDTDLGFYGISPLAVGGDTITSSDVVRRRWLDNDFYGGIASLNYRRKNNDIWVGGGWNRYVGDHFGEVIWAQFASDSDIRDRYYDNEATKTDGNVYFKITHLFTDKLSLFGDLQYRRVGYDFGGQLADRTVPLQSETYDFFNPKAGLVYRPGERSRAFVSFAVGSKEPNRDDHIESGPDTRPAAQKLYDLEMGYSLQHSRYALDLVLYNMDYDDQLIATGEVNDVGENIRTNVPESYRRGIEIIGRWKPTQRVDWAVNVGLSENKVVDFTDFTNAFDADFNELEQLRTDHGTTDIAFSPNIIMGNTLTYHLIEPTESKNELSVALFSKYVGQQYLDNTSNEDKAIDAFFTNDLRLNYRLLGKGFKEIRLVFMLRNVLDAQYSAGGYTYKYIKDGSEVTFNAFSPQAGRNVMAGVTFDF